jgi:hypothetical protein
VTVYFTSSLSWLLLVTPHPNQAMASKSQIIGMRSVYLVAVELLRLGFVVLPTSRSQKGI